CQRSRRRDGCRPSTPRTPRRPPLWPTTRPTPSEAPPDHRVGAGRAASPHAAQGAPRWAPPGKPPVGHVTVLTQDSMMRVAPRVVLLLLTPSAQGGSPKEDALSSTAAEL